MDPQLTNGKQHIKIAQFWNLLHLLDSNPKLAHQLAVAESIFTANEKLLLLLAAFNNFMLLCEGEFGVVCEKEL